jgi:hypothetical protein
MELERERGLDRERSEFARDLGWRPGLGDGEGGIRTELDTVYQRRLIDDMEQKD